MQEKSKVLSGWQRKAYDGIKPVIDSFASNNKGTIYDDGDVTSIRVLTMQGYVTVQVSFRGRNDDCKVEVTGIRRSGYETKRTLLSVNQSDPKVDETEMKTALSRALFGD
jgi:hypothetical protein